MKLHHVFFTLLLSISYLQSHAASVVVKASAASTLTGAASLVESQKYLTFTRANAGKATYQFAIATAGSYKLRIKAIARKASENSVYFALDSGAKVAVDLTISAIAIETAYSKDLILSKGTHKIVFSGKEPYIKMESFTFESVAVTPAPSPSPSPSPTVVPSPSPSPAPVGSWWKPAPGQTIHIQFAGTMDYSKNVSAYDVDVYDTPIEKITALKARGVKVICYFSGGSYEDWRSDAKDFPTTVLGKNLDGWPGEKWLDVRQISLLMPIMKKRMELAKAKGCDAVDPDNMDGFTNDTGWKGTITYAHQLAYNRAIAEQAHALGLSVGLKNDLLQIKDLADLYDFGINESCMDYNECDYLKGFTVDKNKAVFAIDYNGKSAATCAKAKAIKVDMVFKSWDLNANDAFCD